MRDADMATMPEGVVEVADANGGKVAHLDAKFETLICELELATQRLEDEWPNLDEEEIAVRLGQITSLVRRGKSQVSHVLRRYGFATDMNGLTDGAQRAVRLAHVHSRDPGLEELLQEYISDIEELENTRLRIAAIE